MKLRFTIRDLQDRLQCGQLTLPAAWEPTMPEARLKPRWFRFSLRKLFVGITVGCIWLGWQMKWYRDRRAMLAFPSDGDEIHVTANVIVEGWRRGKAPWSLRLIKAEGYSDIGLRAFAQHAETPNTQIIASQEEQKQAVSKMDSLFPEARVSIRPAIGLTNTSQGSRPRGR